MLVVSYEDFVADAQKYVNAAKLQGIRIKPEKKSRLGRRQQKMLAALDAVTGIVPSDVDFDAVKTEEILKH